MVDGEVITPVTTTPPVSAEILRISGQGNCKEAIYALENGFFDAKIVSSPPYTKRFCRFSKSSKSVGVGFSRLKNQKGF